MGKTLRRIVDTERYKMKFSQGDLRVPYESPQKTFKSPQTEKKYITCHYFLKSAKHYFDNLKIKLSEIINYIPKII